MGKSSPKWCGIRIFPITFSEKGVCVLGCTSFVQKVKGFYHSVVTWILEETAFRWRDGIFLNLLDVFIQSVPGSGVPFSLQPLDPLCQAAREGLSNWVVWVDDDDDDDDDDDEN